MKINKKILFSTLVLSPFIVGIPIIATTSCSSMNNDLNPSIDINKTFKITNEQEELLREKIISYKNPIDLECFLKNEIDIFILNNFELDENIYEGTKIYLNTPKSEYFYLNFKILIKEYEPIFLNDFKTMIKDETEKILEIVDDKIVGLKSGYEEITTIVIPNNVKSIENNAFKDNRYIETIDFSQANNLKYVGEYCFYNCINLSRIILSENIKDIQYGEYTFGNCDNLESEQVNQILISSTPYIRNGLFNNCDKIKNVILPNHIQFIQSYAFAKCKNLTHFISSKNSLLDMIDHYVFMDSLQLKNVKLGKNISFIGSSAFENCISLINFEHSSLNINYVFSAFKNCPSLSNFSVQLIINSTKSEISKELITNVKNELNIYIPNNINKISKLAFNNCNIKEVTLKQGNNCIKIENNAFSLKTNIINEGRELIK